MSRTDTSQGTAERRAHEPDQDRFRVIRSEEVDWKPFAAFPPAARLAVLVGEPTQRGPYVIRVRMPGGTKMMLHEHSEDRIYTVISAWGKSSTRANLALMDRAA
jgi:hypothetical protein